MNAPRFSGRDGRALIQFLLTLFLFLTLSGKLTAAAMFLLAGTLGLSAGNFAFDVMSLHKQIQQLQSRIDKLLRDLRHAERERDHAQERLRTFTEKEKEAAGVNGLRRILWFGSGRPKPSSGLQEYRPEPAAHAS